MLKKIKKIALYYSLVILALSFDTAFANQETSPKAPQLYHTAEPHRLRQTFEEAIIHAKKSILIFSFSFSDLDFIELLNQKAEEGLDVVVVINKDHQGSLLTYGSDRIQIVTRFHGEGRVHHKILLIDDEDVWVGSANFSASAFTSQENFVVGLNSTALAQAVRYEAEVFLGNQSRVDGPTPLEKFNDQEVRLYLLPNSDPRYNGPEKNMNEKGKQELLSTIRNAKSHIRIAMMVWTDPELEQAVLDAHKRGVLVEVLMQDMQDTVSRNLKKAGVFITTNPHLNFMHNKWMWVDEEILINGSANWSRSTFTRNDESFLVLKNLNKNQNSYLEEYWTDLLTR